MTRRWGAPRSTSRGTTGAGRAARTLLDRLLDALEDRHARRVHTYNASQKKGNP